MAPKYARQEVIARLKKEIEAGKPIYTVGAGTGISAKFAEAGGADLITTYPIAKFRMMGHSSLAGYLPSVIPMPLRWKWANGRFCRR